MPFITKRRLCIPTVTLCFYGEGLLLAFSPFWSIRYTEYTQMLFPTQSSFHYRKTIHNLPVRKENYYTNTVFGLFSAAYNWEMPSNSMYYGENLRSNIAELGQVRTSADCHHPILVSNTGIFPCVSARGTCMLEPLFHCLLKCRRICSIPEYFFLALHALNWRSGFQAALLRACCQR